MKYYNNNTAFYLSKAINSKSSYSKHSQQGPNKDNFPVGFELATFILLVLYPNH